MRKIRLQSQNKNETFELSGPKNIVDDISGLGTKTLIENNKTINFAYEQIKMKIHFGIDSHAYGEYNKLAKFLLDNEYKKIYLIYDFGFGERRCDVIAKNITKTQKTRYNIISETLTLERLTPFYELSSIKYNDNASDEIINSHTRDLPLYLKIRTDGSEQTVVELKNNNDEVTSKIVIPPFLLVDHNLDSTELVDIYIDPEEKKVQIYQNEVYKKSGYDLVNHQFNTFIFIPKGKYTVSIQLPSSASSYIIEEIKQWVHD